jgi:1,4-dihydroxy-2-naphthoate polyprenyltransferase
MIKKILKFVEIQTKITSLLTFVLVLLVFGNLGMPIKGYETIIFFLGMFAFDLTTTSINNYIDSKTNDQEFGMSRHTMKLILFSLLTLSFIFGLWLVWITNWVVLLIGAFCFLVGIMYTYGPIAISRHPYGEIISGVLYGYFIPFILVFINYGDAFLAVSVHETINIALNTDLLIKFIIFGLIPTLLTSAIMLGNNTCDVEKDIKVGRYTLPYYIGQDSAVKLLYAHYILVYLGVVMGVMVGLYHPLMLGVGVTFPVAMKHVKAFSIACNKEISFVNVIKNFIMIMVVSIILQSIIIVLF